MIPQPTQPSARSPLYASRGNSISAQDLQAWIALRKRRRARIKLVGLTVLVICVSTLGLMWSFFHQQILAVSHVRSMGFTVDWDLNKDNFLTRGTTSVAMPIRRSFTEQITGRDLEQIALLPHVVSLDLSSVRLQDDDLAFLSRLEGLTNLGLERVRLPSANMFGPQPIGRLRDRALKNIRGLKKLVTLGLKDNGITDDGLAYLQDLQSLKDLDLTNNPITDAGLLKLSNLQSLETLDLEGTRVTAKGLDALKGLKNLRFVRVEKTAITLEAAVPFQSERPDVLIDRDKTAVTHDQ